MPTEYFMAVVFQSETSALESIPGSISSFTLRIPHRTR